MGIQREITGREGWDEAYQKSKNFFTWQRNKSTDSKKEMRLRREERLYCRWHFRGQRDTQWWRETRNRRLQEWGETCESDAEELVHNWDTARSEMSQLWRVMDKSGYRQLPPPGILCSQQREATVTPTLSTAKGRQEEKSGWRHSLGAGFLSKAMQRQNRTTLFQQCILNRRLRKWLSCMPKMRERQGEGTSSTFYVISTTYFPVLSSNTVTVCVTEHTGGLCQNFDIYKREAEYTDRVADKWETESIFQ